MGAPQQDKMLHVEAAPVQAVVAAEATVAKGAGHVNWPHVALVVQHAVSYEAEVLPATAPHLVLSAYLVLGQVMLPPPKGLLAKQEVAVTSQQVCGAHEATLLVQAVAAAEVFAVLPAGQVNWAHVALAVQHAASYEASVVPASIPCLPMSLYLADVHTLLLSTLAARHCVATREQQSAFWHVSTSPEHMLLVGGVRATVPVLQTLRDPTTRERATRRKRAYFMLLACKIGRAHV